MKKSSLTVFVILLLMIVIGYISADAAQPDIQQEMRTHISTHRISGFDLRGPVPIGEVMVYSEIRFPFVVVASYAVPRDLHVSYYRTSYLAFPWGFYKLSQDEIHLV
ncbi:hypothetical protein [Xanthomonas arboricola]|uniref:hypothetical protein n=1 Tax=Xanthomonas arboricola TaxID=56448 RepID=UPI000E1E564B|nr:hypothetical protein [Xanthomonas arboricola]